MKDWFVSSRRAVWTLMGFQLVFRALVSGPARRHPLRVLLPVIGVAIGVAAMAAILYANQSVSTSFREAAASIAGRSDFVIKGVRGVPLPALASLSFLWKFGSFAPAVTGSVVLADGSGEIVEVLGVDPGGDGAIRQMRLAQPSGPSRRILLSPQSVFVPVSLAARHRLALGQTLPIIAGGVSKSVTVAGLLELTGIARASGGDLLVTDLFTAQRLLGKEGYVDRVDVVLEPGVSRPAIRQRIAARLAPGLSLEAPGRSAETADRMVRAFRFNLNALGSLTLLVGMFLIANAVSISVLRRRPEIATARALGASRASIFAVFLAEGLMIGAAGTALGEAGGIVLARAALRAVARTVSNVYLPTARIAATDFRNAAALAALVGMAAALAAAILPAAEAMRVPPAMALRPGSVETARQKSLKGRGTGAVFLLLAAAVASRVGSIDGFPLFGFAAMAFVVGALALTAPLLVRAGSLLAGGPLTRLFGPAGRLAAGFFGGALARNAIAVSALALALGMTLAMIVTVASIRQTVRLWVETTLQADLWIKAVSGKGHGLVGDLPPEILPFLRSVPGVADVDPFRACDVTDDRGRPFTLASGDFRVVARIGGLPLVDGGNARSAALEARRRGEVLISEPYARRFDVREGALLLLPTPRGPRSFRVRGIYRDYSNDRGTVVLDRELYLSLFDDPRVTSVAVVAQPGINVLELRRRVLARSSGLYAISAATNGELRREVLRVFDQTFDVTRALEAIAVSVAILGIANALTASAVERRRAFGLLRALGAEKGQIRRALLLEAGLTGATSAAVCLPAAGGFAFLLLSVINPQSFGWTVAWSVPWGKLGGATALVVAASVAAGISPGRLAASVDPAAALAEE